MLVLPREAFCYWEGGDIPSGGRRVEARFRWDTEVATDYDRACDVDEWAAILQVGPAWSLVLGSEVQSVRVLNTPQTSDLLVVNTVYSDPISPDSFLDLFAQIDPGSFHKLGSGLAVREGELLLVHAAVSSRDSYREITYPAVTYIGDVSRIIVSPGLYDIDYATCEIAGAAFHVFSRIRLVNTVQH